MKHLTPRLRARIKAPFGKLVRKGLQKLLLGKTVVVCVGDITTLRLASLGITPRAIIIDYKYMRKPVTASQRRKLGAILAGRKIYKVKNAAGTVSARAYSATRRAVQARRLSAVVVEGEEDLLAIPAVMFAPPGCVVVYGQPRKGVVAISVGAKSRRRAKNMYRAFT